MHQWISAVRIARLVNVFDAFARDLHLRIWETKVKPENLLFAKTHEWAAVANEGGAKVATVGISAFAVEALTDLVFIELPKVGAKVEAEQPFCEVESVKAVSDVYAPVAGEVIAVNETLPERWKSSAPTLTARAGSRRSRSPTTLALRNCSTMPRMRNNAPKKDIRRKGKAKVERRMMAALTSSFALIFCRHSTFPFHLPMPYLYNTDDDRQQMLAAIGAASVDELFDQVPEI